ncbi:MAG TPA: cyclic peptide export ABC transporter [Thermoanaerobaculia bacterium]|nr:cyclic peptide export ABC transporter [Thermoanaerobaculia bacterium]
MLKLIYFLLRNARFAVVLAVVAGLIGGGASAGLIALINLSLSRQADVGSQLFWAFVGLCLLVPVARFTSGYLLVRLAQKAIFDLRLGLSRRIVAARLRSLEEVGNPRLLASLTDDVMTISEAAVNLPFLSMQIAILVGCLVFLAWLSMPVFVAVFLFLALAVTFLKFMETRAAGSFQSARDSQDALYDHFKSLTEGNKELKLHSKRRGAFLDRVLGPTAEKYRHSQVVGRTIYNVVGSWAQILFFGLLGLIIFALPRFYEVDMAVQMGYIITILYILGPLESVLNSLLPSFMRAGIALRKVQSLGLSLDENATETPADPDAATPAWKSLELEGVTHSYHREGEGEDFVVGPLDLRLAPGELVFLIGGNGSGKTTLAKLLTGLYSPEQGRMLLDGEPVTDENRDTYRQLFSVVFNDFHLFTTLLGLEEPELDRRAEHYLEMLRLGSKVSVTGGHLSTIQVSQGQRKRLALLTAYLEDRPIYLFDEWAADQDPEFKRVFYLELLPELKARGKTTIVISHDDHYYHLADRIVKLDDGRIEYDKHNEPTAASAEARRLAVGGGGHEVAWPAPQPEGIAIRGER